MDYLEYFGLKDDPFRLTPDPEYFYPSHSHDLGIRALNYCIDQQEGFCVITGEPGTGKTTLLNVFIRNWKDRAEIALILTPQLMPEEFLHAVMEDLGIKTEAATKNELIKEFRDFLINKQQEGRKVIIIVDEAQNLPIQTIEELRLLSNLETDKEKLLQIILVGQPELETLLKSQQLRQLDQRIVTRVRLSLLDPEETRDYLNFRLLKAGKKSLRFTDSAIKSLHRLTRGNPRLINIYAKRALMAGYLEDTSQITKSHIQNADKSISKEGHSKTERPRYLLHAGAIIILIVTAVFAYSFLFSRNEIKTLKTVSNLSADTQTSLKTEYATVNVPTANVRLGPGLNYRIIATVSSGQRFRIREVKRDTENRKWYRITLGEENHGWLSEAVVTLSEEEPLPAQ